MGDQRTGPPEGGPRRGRDTATARRERCRSPGPAAPGRVTRLLRSWSKGSPEAAELLFAEVYPELRRQARRRLGREPAPHSIQVTDLLHETYLRLVDQKRVDWRCRDQFFAVSATLARRVLVDRARARSRDKRGGGAIRLTLDQLEPRRLRSRSTSWISNGPWSSSLRCVRAAPSSWSCASSQASTWTRRRTPWGSDAPPSPDAGDSRAPGSGGSSGPSRETDAPPERLAAGEPPLRGGRRHVPGGEARRSRRPLRLGRGAPRRSRLTPRSGPDRRADRHRCRRLRAGSARKRHPAGRPLPAPRSHRRGRAGRGLPRDTHHRRRRAAGGAQAPATGPLGGRAREAPALGATLPRSPRASEHRPLLRRRQHRGRLALRGPRVRRGAPADRVLRPTPASDSCPAPALPEGLRGGSSTPTASWWSIATSSPATSWLPTKASRSCSTSALPRPSHRTPRRTKPAPRPASGSSLPTTRARSRGPASRCPRLGRLLPGSPPARAPHR